MHVLLVDENPKVACRLGNKIASLKEHLLIFSYAQNVEDAVEFLSKQEPRLVILSLTMPDKQGQEAYRLIKERTSADLVVSGPEDSYILNKMAMKKEAFAYVERNENVEEYANRLAFIARELAKELVRSERELSDAIRELEESDSTKNRLKTIRKICSELHSRGHDAH